MDSLRQDLRFAVRMLARNPGLTAVAVLCIALGIGTNVTAFSVVSAVLLRPFPYAEPERLVYIRTTNLPQDVEAGGMSYLDYLDLRQGVHAFSQVEAYGIRSLVVGAAEGGEPERISGVGISAGLFPLVGETPALGRNFRAFAGIAFLLTTVASLASFLPANRAMEVDPLEALRNE